MTYRAADRATWNAIFRAVPGDWFSAGPSDAMVRCLSFFRQHQPRRLLDVGAGIGRWAIYLARNGIAPNVALDSAARGSRVTAEWAAREGLRVVAATGDAVALPFVDRSFDAILAALVLENLDRRDQLTAMAELRRVADRGAHGFFVFNPILTDAEIEALAHAGNPTRTCHIESCTDDEITEMLAGWQTVERGKTEEGFRYVAAWT
jgi:ubiquinone/menaquinone biosynthesis C-methylase UbiE